MEDFGEFTSKKDVPEGDVPLVLEAILTIASDPQGSINLFSLASYLNYSYPQFGLQLASALEKRGAFLDAAVVYQNLAEISSSSEEEPRLWEKALASVEKYLPRGVKGHQDGGHIINIWRGYAKSIEETQPEEYRKTILRVAELCSEFPDPHNITTAINLFEKAGDYKKAAQVWMQQWNKSHPNNDWLWGSANSGVLESLTYGLELLKKAGRAEEAEALRRDNYATAKKNLPDMEKQYVRHQNLLQDEREFKKYVRDIEDNCKEPNLDELAEHREQEESQSLFILESLYAAYSNLAALAPEEEKREWQGKAGKTYEAVLSFLDKAPRGEDPYDRHLSLIWVVAGQDKRKAASYFAKFGPVQSAEAILSQSSEEDIPPEERKIIWENVLRKKLVS